MTISSQPDPARRVLDGLEQASRRPITAAGALASASALLWVGQAWLAADLIGALVYKVASVERALLAVALFAALGLLRHAGEFSAGRLAFRAAQRIVADRRAALVESESLASPFAVAPGSSASAATLIGTKLDLLVPWLTRYRLAAIKVAVVPLAILAAAAVWSWAAGVILLASGPLIPLFMALIGYAAREASERHMAETGTLNVMLLEWLNAGADIRLLNAEGATVASFDAAADSLRARSMAVLRIAFLSSTVLELFSALGIALAAVYVGFSLLGTFSFGTYSAPLTVTGGIFILLLVPDFFQPLRELAAAWHDRAAALAVAGEIAELENRTGAHILGRGGKAAPLVGAPTITVNNLAFATSAARAIRFPDFTVAAGEKLAITGESGAGKTTLLGLIAGFMAPSAGTIAVAGVPLDGATADGWRQRIGYVGQHPHMLNASLRVNVALNDAHADPHKLDEALQAAAAEDILAGLPRRAETRLGENGAGVSGGEARRLTIARAIYAGVDVILADEPTADLDSATADKVADALVAAAENGASLIVATHDPRLAARMDREVKLVVAP
jgi:ATP-binding cassette, subfamily C, bacterial CydD